MSSSVRQRTVPGSLRSEKSDASFSSVESSDIRPAVASSVIAKLLIFTLAMVTVPLGAYFLSVRTVFQGNPTFAGGLAALMANVVLMGYIFVAVKDDQAEREEDASGGKEGRKGAKDE
jgi:vacuolar ATPase assembly integral membrane protein VMA21